MLFTFDRLRNLVGKSMKTTKPRRSAEQTAAAIVESAAKLFLAHGYAGTNLEQVAKDAGVTKPTVYSHFGSKQALLQKVTGRNTDHRIEAMSNELQPTADLRDDLTRFGDVVLANVLSEQAQAWHRFASAEAMTYPEVGAAFYAAGPARVLDLLTAYLTAQRKSGRIKMDDPRRAAEQLLGLLVGLELLRSRIGQSVKSPDELQQHCRDCVDMFLNAYRVD